MNTGRLEAQILREHLVQVLTIVPYHMQHMRMLLKHDIDEIDRSLADKNDPYVCCNLLAAMHYFQAVAVSTVLGNDNQKTS